MAQPPEEQKAQQNLSPTLVIYNEEISYFRSEKYFINKAQCIIYANLKTHLWSLSLDLPGLICSYLTKTRRQSEGHLSCLSWMSWMSPGSSCCLLFLS